MQCSRVGEGWWVLGIALARIRSPPPCARAVVGTLKGFDDLVNLVLDNAVEYLRGASPTPLSSPGRVAL